MIWVFQWKRNLGERRWRGKKEVENELEKDRNQTIRIQRLWTHLWSLHCLDKSLPNLISLGGPNCSQLASHIITVESYAFCFLVFSMTVTTNHLQLHIASFEFGFTLRKNMIHHCPNLSLFYPKLVVTNQKQLPSYYVASSFQCGSCMNIFATQLFKFDLPYWNN